MRETNPPLLLAWCLRWYNGHGCMHITQDFGDMARQMREKEQKRHKRGGLF